MEEIYVNFKSGNVHDSLTILLGIEKHILKDFRYTNIQLIVGNDFDYYPVKLDILVDAIGRAGSEVVNVIGLSKTCTAAVVYAAELAGRFPEMPIRLFLFSPYTTIEEGFYRDHGLLDKVPRSLKIMWTKNGFAEDFYHCRGLKCLPRFKNIQTFLVYPLYGLHSEPECASWVAAQEGVTLVPMPASTHAVLYPFWNKLRWDLKIETFENEYSYLSVKDFWYFRLFQERFALRESLYELIFDHEPFLKKLAVFNKETGRKRIPTCFFLFFTLLNYQLRCQKMVARNWGKLNRAISRLFGGDMSAGQTM